MATSAELVDNALNERLVNVGRIPEWMHRFRGVQSNNHVGVFEDAHSDFFAKDEETCYKARMKGDRLGEFEELTLLAVQALGDRTYGVPVQQFVARATGRDVAIGAVYAALDRLERKGFVRSVLGDATPVRGGKRKRLFEATPLGVRTLRELRRVRERIWKTIEAGRQT